MLNKSYIHHLHLLDTLILGLPGKAPPIISKLDMWSSSVVNFTHHKKNIYTSINLPMPLQNVSLGRTDNFLSSCHWIVITPTEQNLIHLEYLSNDSQCLNTKIPLSHLLCARTIGESGMTKCKNLCDTYCLTSSVYQSDPMQLPYNSLEM